MLSFLARTPPKTPQAHLQTIHTEDGQNTLEFFAHDDPKAEYGMKSHLKAGPTIHVPPYHWHRYQAETFLIHAGTMRATLEGREQLVQAGTSITIAPGLYHTFVNGSDTDPLVVSTGLDPTERARDEAFFRNLYCYLDDCRRAGMAPHVAQLCLFLHFFDCYLALPGPKALGKPLSRVLVFVLGVVVGKWLLGFRESYPEYHKRETE